jgi:hypothetical protein
MPRWFSLTTCALFVFIQSATGQQLRFRMMADSSHQKSSTSTASEAPLNQGVVGSIPTRPISTFIFGTLSVLLYAVSLNATEPAIDFGSIEGSVYSHSYFGLKVTIPEKWQVQDQDARQRLMELGEQVVTGNNENLKALMDASKLNTLNLLTVFRHPLGAAVDFKPSFMCIAEKVSHLPGIQRGSDFCLLMP